jgi:hypothetical protein
LPCSMAAVDDAFWPRNEKTPAQSIGGAHASLHSAATTISYSNSSTSIYPAASSSTCIFIRVFDVLFDYSWTDPNRDFAFEHFKTNGIHGRSFAYP